MARVRAWIAVRLFIGLVAFIAAGAAAAAAPGDVSGDVSSVMSGGGAGQAEAPALHLGSGTRDATAWPALRILDEPGGRLDAAAAHAQLGNFTPPDTPFQNLGQRRAAVWLHVPLQVAADAPPRWVARIDYPALREVELALFDTHGQLLQRSLTGASVPFTDRPVPSRALAVELVLQPGQRYDLLLRVHTATAAIVPLHLHPWPAFSALESRDQITFGLLCGLIAFMLVYSATLWFSMHQPAFLAYALLLCANGLFALGLYGVGPQYVWPHSRWLSVNMTVASSLLVVAANLYFCLYALDVRQDWPRLARLVRICAGLLSATLAAFLGGLIDYRQSAVVASAGAVLDVALLLPVALQRWRRNDRVAAFLLLGWLSFAGSMVMMTVLLRGLLPAATWSQYGAQVGAIGEMLSWLVALNLKVKGLRHAAERSRREHDLLHALAHTDPLTGLVNRRGLELAQREHMARLSAGPRRGWRVLSDRPDRPAPPGRPDLPDRPGAPTRCDALFMLDLDGFKQVNDRLGHEAGDRLLTEVARRLRQATRNDDLVARLGGDEFVLIVRGLHGPDDARSIGAKLLAQFDRPMDLGEGRMHRIAATIGCSLSGNGRLELADWLRTADAAMYRGKLAGKGRLCGLDDEDATATVPAIEAPQAPGHPASPRYTGFALHRTKPCA